MDNGFNFCLVTNECSTAKRLLAKKLNNFGFHRVEPSKMVSPSPVACRYLCEQGLRPRLHLWDGLLEDFEPIISRMANDPKPPNCLVIGDAMHKISRDFIDESLELMLNSPEDPIIIALGAGRYFKDAGHLRMDTGAYAAAYEYCLGTKAINIGKPSETFFREALDVVKGTAEDTIMIGDDIVSDVGGALKMGMRSFQVRTGKFKESDLTKHGIAPTHVFNNLKEAIDTIIRYK